MARRLALWLTLPTGFAGLVYEVTWEQSLATLLGSHSEAAAAVLALFLGGLAAGYALFGRLARRVPEPTRLLRLYGAVEIAIGLYALIFPELLSAARVLSPRLPALSEGPAFAADLVLSAVLLAPPAIALGATIPLLTQALPRTPAEATRIHARVYALNTLGAFFGALAAAFWILPALGLSGALYAMACVNLAAGAAYFAIAPALRTQPAREASASQSADPWRVPPAAAGAALLLGFAMMTAQTTMLRLAALAFGGSPFTFAMVVAVFVLCIATGSAAVSLLRRVPAWLLAADLAVLFVWLYVLYAPLENAPYFGHRLRAAFSSEAASFLPYHAAVFAGLLAVIGPAALLSGASLPLLFDRLRRDRDDTGRVAGRLYAWNTLGSVAGALAGGYALLLWFDLHHVYRVAVAAVGCAAALLLERPRGVVFRGVGVALVLAALALQAPWSATRLSSGAYRIREATAATAAGPSAFFDGLVRTRLLFYDDDPSASIAVKEFLNEVGQTDRNLITNGKSDGAALTEYTTTALLGLLPALFAERAERAFVIGLGTGVTAAELASLEGMREVQVAEISRAVLEAAPLFDEQNGGVTGKDAVRLIRGDAYRSLLRSDGLFDVISSEPSNPWVGGVEMLFSREFLTEGRRHLTPGGVFAQWLQLYETDATTLELVLRTLASVFDDVSVWYGMETDLLLLGHRRGARSLDLAELERRARRPDFAAALERAGISDLPALLAHELLPLGSVRALGLEGPLHTLTHPRLRHAAARAFHVGGRAWPPMPLRLPAARVADENSLWRRYVRSGRARFPELDRESFASETCYRLRGPCLSVLAEWTHDTPGAQGISRVRREVVVRAGGVEQAGLARLGPLSRLFDEDAMLSPGSEGVKQATEATRLYAQYQHPATPFSRAGIRARWRRCEAEAARRDDCLRARRELEAEFGPLGIDP